MEGSAAIHGKPSSVLEGRIGFAYTALGEDSLAIEHFSNALAVRESALAYLNRGYAYLDLSRCDLAVIDAEASLSLEPVIDIGFHSSAEAFAILALCHAYNGDFQAAVQHAEVAMSLAEQYQYPAEDLANWNDVLIEWSQSQ